MALTPNQLAALPVAQRIFGLQTIAGYNPGEKYKAFICYGCREDGFYATSGSYPHLLSIDKVPSNKVSNPNV